MLRVYLASWFDSKDERAKQAQELRSLGIEVTSRWLEERTDIKIDDAFLNDTANVDIEDIEQANVLVIFTPDVALPKPGAAVRPGEEKDQPLTCKSWARGGRNFEQGYFYAMMRFFEYLPLDIQGRGKRELVICGKRETLFHWTCGGKFKLPCISKQFDNWKETKKYLASRA